nr:xylulose kinase-1 [Tanacetum cinerariifolium]
MTSQSAFSFPDPSSFSTQQATFTSFLPEQTSELVTNSQPNPQTSNNFQNQPFQQYHTATLLIIQNGNSKKILGRDSKGGIIILPPVSFEEHVAVQRETKARTLLLQSLLEDHMVDFHHLDDAKEIWLVAKARFGENTTNTLKYSETLYDQANIEKKEWEFKFVESLARECNVKKVDEKARYSAFKILKTEEGEQVYGLMAGFESDFTDYAGNAAGSVSNAAAGFP